MNPNVDVPPDVGRKIDNGGDFDDVVNVKVLPSEMNVVNKVGGVDILLGDLVQVEGVVDVDSDDDNGDDEVLLNEACLFNVGIFPVIDAVVDDHMIDDRASESGVEVLLNVAEDVDDSRVVSEDECE